MPGMATRLAGPALLLAAALGGCGGAGTALDSEEWPRGAAEKPAAADLVGTWRLSAESAALARRKLGGGEFRTKVELRQDGTASVRQVPGCIAAAGAGPATDAKALRDIDGKWSLSAPQGYWAVTISDKGGQAVLELYLWNRRAPYRLWQAIGDPDTGDFLFLDREAATGAAGKAKGDVK
jgi:hypothetical protein